METNQDQLNTSAWATWITQAAQDAAGIENLPAVATSDWAELAALRLKRLPGVLGVAVVLGRIKHPGDPVEVDAVGVCSGAAVPGRISLSDQAALSVRSRLEKLGSSQKLVHGSPVLGVPNLWDDTQDRITLQSWDRVGGADRVVIVLVGLHLGDASDPVRLGATLDVLTPMLARRARLALGDGPGVPTWLTERERLVLEQLILGKSVRTIADLIDRSPHTVHDHVKNLHRKLGASSRGALIAKALGRNSTVEEPKPVLDRGPLTFTPDLAQSGAPTRATHLEHKPGTIASRMAL